MLVNKDRHKYTYVSGLLRGPDAGRLRTPGNDPHDGRWSRGGVMTGGSLDDGSWGGAGWRPRIGRMSRAPLSSPASYVTGPRGRGSYTGTIPAEKLKSRSNGISQKPVPRDELDFGFESSFRTLNGRRPWQLFLVFFFNNTIKSVPRVLIEWKDMSQTAL